MSEIVEKLRPIFEPNSIAVLGASDQPGKWGYVMVQRPLKSGFSGDIYPVNPGKKEIFGLRTYTSISDIPNSIDLAVISAPAVTVPNLMRECAAKGVKGAVVISAGFAEAGKEGKVLEEKILGIAREGGIRFVGPNCMGIWSASGKLNPEPSLSFLRAALSAATYRKSPVLKVMD
jgi:acetyltransferase